MNLFPLSGNNDEDDNNYKEFSDESTNETTSSLFVYESWLNELHFIITIIY
jgi:hypothetical protein